MSHDSDAHGEGKVDGGLKTYLALARGKLVLQKTTAWPPFDRFGGSSATSAFPCPSSSWWPSTRSSPGSTPTCSTSRTGWRSPGRKNEAGSSRPWDPKARSRSGSRSWPSFRRCCSTSCSSSTAHFASEFGSIC